MTLRRKTLIRIGLTIAGLILVLYVTSRAIVLRSFAELEEQDAYQNTERVTSVLSDYLGKLSSTVADWAYWNNTVDFVEGSYEGYIEDNLGDSTLVNLRVNLMLFTDSSDQIVFFKAVDLQSEQETSIQGLQEHIYANAPLIRHTDTESSITGIILLPAGPMLVASRPILTSEQEGPIRGALVIGRYLDDAEIQHLAETTRLSLDRRLWNDSQMPSDFQTAQSFLSVETPVVVRPLNAEAIAGYTMLEDVYGEPALVLRVDIPRDIYKQGQASVSYFAWSLLVASLVFGLVTLLLLERQVLSRLARISRTVGDIGASGDLSVRVTVSGEDELSSLAGEINNMLTALQESDAQLEERNRDLARRARYLEATSKVAQDATSVLDLQELLSRIVTLISERFGFYHAAIFLLDATGEWAVLQAASSEGGRRVLARGFRLRVGQEGIVGYVTGHDEPRIALDVGADAVFFDDPELPDTRSEMAWPLRARGEIIGALDVQSKEPAAFDQEDVAVLHTLADQVAIALSNARLFQQLQESLERQQWVFDQLSRRAWTEMLHARPSLGYRYDRGQVIPLDDQPKPQGEQRMDGDARRPEPGEELPEFTIPIKARGGVVIGTLNVRKPGDAGDWTPEEATLLETLTDQLGVALESARLYQDTQRRAARERLTREITDSMRRTVDMDALMRTTIQSMTTALGAAGAFVHLSTPSEPEDEEGNGK